MKHIEPNKIFGILVFVAFCALTSNVHGQNYSFEISNGNWSQTIDVSDILDAGLDYANKTRTSAADEAFLEYWRQGGGAAGRNFSMTMEISKVNIDWNDNIQLWVRRTGDGTQPNPQCGIGGNILGGTFWQQVTNTPTLFFSGQCRRSNVPIQMELRNISVLEPTGTKSVEVVYTITFTQL